MCQGTVRKNHGEDGACLLLLLPHLTAKQQLMGGSPRGGPTVIDAGEQIMAVHARMGCPERRKRQDVGK